MTVSEVAARPAGWRQEEPKGFLEKAQEVVARVWDAFLTGVQAVWGKAVFFTCRVLEWIHPTLGLRFENSLLWITNIWNSFKEAWRNEEIGRELRQLREQNRQMRERTASYDQISDERNLLREQNDRLSHGNQLMTERQQNFLEREQAVVNDRDFLLARNRQLESEREVWVREREAVSEQMHGLVAAREQLSHQLAMATQQIDQLESQVVSGDQLKEALDRIREAAERSSRIPGAQASLDDVLGDLIPVLQEQLRQTREELLQEQERLRGTAAEIPIRGALRAIDGLNAGCFSELAGVFRYNRNCNSRVDELLRLLPVQAIEG